MNLGPDSPDDVYERIRIYARNRAIDNGRDPDLAADIAELEYARGNEKSISAAVEAAAGAYVPKPKLPPVPTLAEVNRLIGKFFGNA